MTTSEEFLKQIRINGGKDSFTQEQITKLMNNTLTLRECMESGIFDPGPEFWIRIGQMAPDLKVDQVIATLVKDNSGLGTMKVQRAALYGQHQSLIYELHNNIKVELEKLTGEEKRIVQEFIDRVL